MKPFSYESDLSPIMDLCYKMDAQRPEYENEIRNNQEYLKQAVRDLTAKGDDFSLCYAGIIQKSISTWWDWVNDSKQMSLF